MKKVGQAALMMRAKPWWTRSLLHASTLLIHCYAAFRRQCCSVFTQNLAAQFVCQTYRSTVYRYVHTAYTVFVSVYSAMHELAPYCLA